MQMGNKISERSKQRAFVVSRLRKELKLLKRLMRACTQL